MMWQRCVLCLLVFGCASTPPAHHVRYADLGSGKLANPFDGRAPLVVEFQAGDRVPVNFVFSGEDFALVPERPALELVAKHRCFVRFWKDGIRASLNPNDFETKPRQPGSFRLGLAAQRGEQPKLDVVIVTPRR
ncbi:MAG: hypothetical protein ACOY0T_29335 [Myxococcota bacterium]